MKIKSLIASAAVAVAGACSLLMIQPAMAVSCPEGSIRGSANTLAEEGGDLMSMLQTIINVVITVLGLVAVAIVILGGVGYSTSQGDPAKATKAKNTILYGIVGLVISLLAFAIVNFVLSEIWGK